MALTQVLVVFEREGAGWEQVFAEAGEGRLEQVRHGFFLFWLRRLRHVIQFLDFCAEIQEDSFDEPNMTVQVTAVFTDANIQQLRNKVYGENLGRVELIPFTQTSSRDPVQLEAAR